MRVVIVGAGRAGCLLAKMLADGGHDVIVVDKSRSVIEEITNRLAVYSPILMDALPLTLEEIFIYELGGEDYEVRDVIL